MKKRKLIKAVAGAFVQGTVLIAAVVSVSWRSFRRYATGLTMGKEKSSVYIAGEFIQKDGFVAVQTRFTGNN